MFAASDEGKQRQKDIVMLPGNDEIYGIMFVECTGMLKKEIAKSHNNHKYLVRCLIESGFEIVSYDSLESEDEGEKYGEEIVPAQYEIDDDVIDTVLCEQIRKKVRTLSKLDQELINSFIDTTSPVSKSEFAKKHNHSVSWCSKRLDIAIDNLRKACSFAAEQESANV